MKINWSDYKLGDLIEVYWDDIEGCTNEPSVEIHPAKAINIGRVGIHKKDLKNDYIKLVTGRYPGSDLYDAVAIPKGCVTRVVRIKEAG